MFCERLFSLFLGILLGKTSRTFPTLHALVSFEWLINWIWTNCKSCLRSVALRNCSATGGCGTAKELASVFISSFGSISSKRPQICVVLVQTGITRFPAVNWLTVLETATSGLLSILAAYLLVLHLHFLCIFFRFGNLWILFTFPGGIQGFILAILSCWVNKNFC